MSLENFVKSADAPEVPDDLIFHTVKQVAALFELHEETVKKLIHDGKLRAGKVGGYFRISRTDLKAYAKTIYTENEDD